jgi:predicted  nucleic acid-binding Zn-ribbon protein
VHADVIALLAVQEDDVSIYDLEHRIAQLMPRVNALAADCTKATAALQQVHDMIAAEQKRRSDLTQRITDHRLLHDKNEAVLNAITSVKEATAAMAQLEQVKKIIAEEDREVRAIGQRLDELQKLAEDRTATLRDLETAKAEAEASVAVDRAGLDKSLGEARTHRDAHSREVPRSLLSRYDRIRSKRRSRAIFPLRGASCSHCDTAIPLQRRTELVGAGATEVCEGCGVLLYASE